jgi:hypothetical protein
MPLRALVSGPHSPLRENPFPPALQLIQAADRAQVLLCAARPGVPPGALKPPLVPAVLSLLRIVCGALHERLRALRLPGRCAHQAAAAAQVWPARAAVPRLATARPAPFKVAQ